MKIGIIGAGAVGGYYGALLVKSGFDVHFLLKSDFEHVRKNGLVIEKDISGIVPSAKVMGGLCFLCSNKIGPGHIRHLDYGSVRLGQYRKDDLPAGVTDELKKVSDIFSKAAIPVSLAGNLGLARWEKLVWNMSFNGTTVILNATTDRIMNNTSSRAMVAEIMHEVICGAKICGYPIAENFTEAMLNATQLMVDYRPSMKIDYDNQRPLEIENIYWRPIRAVEKNGGEMPKSKIPAYQLNFLDQMNRKNNQIF